MRPQKRSINPGDTFGSLTVVQEEEKANNGQRRYLVRCSCGNEYIVFRPRLISAKSECCRHCSDFKNKKGAKGDAVGQTINNWFVLDEVETGKNRVRHFRCKCTVCGTISIKTKGQMKRVKSGRCENCVPDYRFEINGEDAIGTLPDGTKFWVSAQDVQMLSKIYIRVDSDGYLLTSDGPERKNVPLHQLIMEPHDDKHIYIDHINRNRLDCRRSNLRYVTEQQNSMNRSIQCNNTSGYVGVSFVKSKKLYRAQIGIGGKDISLGRSKNPVVCAQMYNVAADLLFGDFRGHRNAVPKADKNLFERMKNRCQPYLAEAELATQPCSPFLYQKAV